MYSVFIFIYAKTVKRLTKFILEYNPCISLATSYLSKELSHLYLTSRRPNSQLNVFILYGLNKKEAATYQWSGREGRR